MKPERINLLLGLVWLILGMGLGEHMGRVGDHSQHVTHAHIMLVGGVLPILFALIYRAFALVQGLLAWIQTLLHHVGAAVMIVSLYMLYGAIAPESTLGPVLGISAMLIILSVVLVLVQALRGKQAA
ncbi:TonB-dependent receptor [Marinicauda algicola]|uniref:TonB-dependent receptor n=1 Tax=Marinicauda algicola TaxID=2029849 RepID=A0A4V6RF57_9PROT|nr:TonB-dependent receptor [Marinicauda algicola]TGY89829.1 TonB-dependent receptor [Marinicauda algicola]